MERRRRRAAGRVRARQRLHERSPGDAPSPDASADRLDAVLRALYLLFNEGYWSGDDEAPSAPTSARSPWA
ncbi:MAG: hypothetical protein U0324_47585 [Polyangiales bacterium]